MNNLLAVIFLAWAAVNIGLSLLPPRGPNTLNVTLWVLAIVFVAVAIWVLRQ